MPAAAHLQPIFDRIQREAVRGQQAARRAFVLDAAARYAADAGARGRTLHRLRIADGDHACVIAAARERLALDRILRLARPFDPPAPVRRWTLLAVWIGERRLRRQTRAVARRFAPLKLAMAAE